MDIQMKHSTNISLHFGRNTNGVIGYVDSDHTEDIGKSRSLTGYVLILGGCAIS